MPDQERNAALVAWYATHGRSLPWRGVSDPYLVLVSEVMLQQTQASRVAARFDAFIERFPTVSDLGRASLADVLGEWVGLGYNRRAANLHSTAGIISERGWPPDVAGLLELPGVGPYTARAVACFGFGLEEVPVDTNVRRVLGRWHGEPLDGDVLQRAAERDRAGSDAAEWSQAVMDLGAALCLPRSPRCEECPVVAWCTGPEIYVAPRSQARFEGSGRQLRGGLIRSLVTGPARVPELAATTGFSREEVAAALADLSEEGLVEMESGLYRLPG